MSRPVSITGLAVILALSSCSPYVDKSSITKFSKTLDTVASLDTTGEMLLNTDIKEDQASIYSATRMPVKYSPAACYTGIVGNTAALPPPPPCKLVPYNAKASVAARKSSPDLYAAEFTIVRTKQEISASRQLFRALQKYALALSAVTNAGDQKTFHDATAKLATAVGNLVTKADKTAKKAPKISSASIDILGAATSDFFLDPKRYSVLKKAVTVADSHIADLGDVIAGSLGTIRTDEISNLQARISSLTNSLSPKHSHSLSRDEYSQAYDNLQVALSALNRISATRPEKLVNTMVEAHHALRSALDSGKGQFKQFRIALVSFSQDANALRKAISSSTMVATTSKASTVPN